MSNTTSKAVRIAKPDFAEYFRVDEAAECFPGMITNETLYARLWSFVPEQGEGPLLAKVWSKLSPRQQEAIVAAHLKYELDIINSTANSQATQAVVNEEIREDGSSIVDAPAGQALEDAVMCFGDKTIVFYATPKQKAQVANCEADPVDGVIFLKKTWAKTDWNKPSQVQVTAEHAADLITWIRAQEGKEWNSLKKKAVWMESVLLGNKAE